MEEERLAGGRRGWGEGGFKIGCREQLQSIVCHLLNYLLSRINVQETSGRAPAAASRRLAQCLSTACSLSKQHPADPGAAAILVKQQQGKVLENKRRSGSSASRRSLTIHSVSFLAVLPARKQRRMRERRRRTYLFGHWADCRGRIKASTGLCGRSPSHLGPSTVAQEESCSNWRLAEIKGRRKRQRCVQAAWLM